MERHDESMIGDHLEHFYLYPDQVSKVTDSEEQSHERNISSTSKGYQWLKQTRVMPSLLGIIRIEPAAEALVLLYYDILYSLSKIAQLILPNLVFTPKESYCRRSNHIYAGLGP
jgi:hypothetical protein